jgi:hypothetical protein
MRVWYWLRRLWLTHSDQFVTDAWVADRVYRDGRIQ